MLPVAEVGRSSTNGSVCARASSKAVESTDFETLEALAEKVARAVVDGFSRRESPGSDLRVRIEKPTAVPLADFPAIEIYRTEAQVMG